ncbi:hypothetical protein MLP_47880 [Microlunatus phosphovorus NM-1]|uniref:Uncharacterized protein n=1 Tax=Microlunatus phosphovorus (strain ATCC 700054 / DSM 10555 / JCM 9379 / NBRC 101784 / NCIMB 13414 / VKM Ac-1990 / NM-1) TaxID=1032480 RepID=F5XF64_MICPN|nr:hypothetical protein MLP_47880 [Microlunatus phosphovorus NM-1]
MGAADIHFALFPATPHQFEGVERPRTSSRGSSDLAPVRGVQRPRTSSRGSATSHQFEGVERLRTN